MEGAAVLVSARIALHARTRSAPSRKTWRRAQSSRTQLIVEMVGTELRIGAAGIRFPPAGCVCGRSASSPGRPHSSPCDTYHARVSTHSDQTAGGTSVPDHTLQRAHGMTVNCQKLHLCRTLRATNRGLFVTYPGAQARSKRRGVDQLQSN